MLGLAASLTVMIGGMAPAESPSGAVALSWEAPADCPDAASVKQDVLSRLGEAEVDRPFAASMSARETKAGFEVSIVIDDAGAASERALQGATCPEVAAWDSWSRFDCPDRDGSGRGRTPTERAAQCRTGDTR